MRKDKHILITGGTGFIGSYIIRTLVRAGYNNITAIKRPSSSLALLGPIADQVQWVDCDLLDVVGIYDITAESNAVIHCGAMVSFAKGDADKLMKVNVEGTANMVNAAIQHQVERFVHISSIASFERKPNEKIIDESTGWEDGKLTTYYARSKYHAEMEVFRGGGEGLSIGILNPSLVLGAGFWSQGSASIFKQIHEGLKFYPKGSTGFVDVRDVANATVLLLEKKIENERFIINGHNLSYKLVFDSIATALSVKKPTILLTPLLNEIAYWQFKMKSALGLSSKVLTRASIRNASYDFAFDNTRSMERLGLSYTPMEKTIQDTATALLESVKSNRTEGTISLLT